MNKLEYAKLFLSMGIAVIPLRHRGKEPASHMMGGTWEKYKTTPPTEYDVTNWLWSDWQNYGVVAGWNDLTIIDFDDPTTFAVWLDYFALLNKHETVVETPFIVKTARGGHAYFHIPGVERVNSKRRGVDIKCNGYVVGPGCIHPSGAIYTPMNMIIIPTIYSLETILPVDLFPPVAMPDVYETNTQLDFSASEQRAIEQYDPFAAASGNNGEDLITMVKRAVRIEFLFSDKRQTSGDGRWYAALCPFHDDHRPSFWIDTRRQLCGCEKCGMKPMDAINLYARLHKVTESVAVSELARTVGVLA